MGCEGKSIAVVGVIALGLGLLLFLRLLLLLQLFLFCLPRFLLFLLLPLALGLIFFLGVVVPILALLAGCISRGTSNYLFFRR